MDVVQQEIVLVDVGRIGKEPLWRTLQTELLLLLLLLLLLERELLELIERVAGWMNQLHDVVRTVAVTHPAVVRAAVLVALDAPPKSFWRIDVAPVSHTVLHRRGGAWTLRI